MTKTRHAVLALSALLGLQLCHIAQAQAQEKTKISVAYGSNYVFDTDDLAKKWWEGVKAGFEAAHPGTTVELVPIAGGYDDIINKLSLLYRSARTAPDVAQIATPSIGQFVSTGYLLPMDAYLKDAAWWPKFPPAIQAEGTFDGKVYAVDTGENDSQLYYNMDMFRQAGLPVPWAPHTWDDILAAARVIKQKLPKIVPLWLHAGTSSGDNAILQGAGNLLLGSTEPTILDEKTHKWVVDSAGLRQVLGFYHSVYSEGLGAKLSDLFSPSAVTIPLDLLAKSQVAICFGSNFYGGNWTKLISAPYWADAPKVMGVLPIPTINGQPPGIATTLGGWDFSIAASSKHPDLAWKLVDYMEGEQQQIDAANWAGFVPANVDYVKLPAFVDFAPPYNAVSAQVLPFGKVSPPSGDYLVWSRGLQEATGALAQHPNTTTDQAIDIMKTYVTNQLGDSAVETIK